MLESNEPPCRGIIIYDAGESRVKACRLDGRKINEGSTKDLVINVDLLAVLARWKRAGAKRARGSEGEGTVGSQRSVLPRKKNRFIALAEFMNAPAEER